MSYFINFNLKFMSVKNKKLTLIIGYGYWGKKVHQVLKSLNQKYIYI